VVAEILGIAKASEATQKSPGVMKIAVVATPASYDTPEGNVEATRINVVARITRYKNCAGLCRHRRGMPRRGGED
jgi:2-methylaconitate cis-trans-isomerase PrpF